jgi:hypothetical protein
MSVERDVDPEMIVDDDEFDTWMSLALNARKRSVWSFHHCKF